MWCPREVTEHRSVGRQDADTAARLAAWDATRADLDAYPGMVWDLSVDTTVSSPEESALLINQLLDKRAGAATV